MKPPSRCPICARSPRKALQLARRVPLLQCPSCLLAWWPWCDFEPASFYDRAYFQSADVSRGYDDYRAMETGLRRTALGRLRRIDCILRAGTRDPVPSRRALADLGCGTGVFLDVARERGWSTSGLEVSDYAAAVARDRGHAVSNVAITRAELESDRFDCVTMWDVIEHLADPAEALSAACAGLRSGGAFALSTGDVTSLCARLCGEHWHLFNLPEHLFFFSPEALRRLLVRSGARVLRIVREPYWAAADYLLERLCKSGRMRAPDWLRRPLRKIHLPANLFDVVGVYAIRGVAR